MGFQVAAAGIGGRIEIDHDRALLQRVLQVEVEILAAQAAGGGEIGGGVADLEGGKSGGGAEGCQKANHKLLFHGVVLKWGAGRYHALPGRLMVEFQVRPD